MTLVEEGIALVDASNRSGLKLRLLGGAAIFIHCPRALAQGPFRELADLDAIVPRAQGAAAARVLADLGYEPEARFNAMHGDRRLIFQGPMGKLDVFVGVFEMCHRIQLDQRLDLEPQTISVSDLLLTKLQIVQLNAKDAKDVAALLLEHDLGMGPGDHVDVGYLGSVLAADWGLWRTATGTLRRVADLDPRVSDPVNGLLDAVNGAPKSTAFKLRARIGDRMRWYELPDEVAN